jgi:serine phosphatase RsbU (regulator of sigma subunit)
MTKDHLPDLILLDIMMPKMDGISVCRLIKSDASLPFIPIIMVTAKAESKDIVAGLDAGGDEYLTKPVEHGALVSRVKSMLRIKTLHDKVHEQSAQLKLQLETATKIQSLFWPKMPELEPGSHIWGTSVPAAYVGGDFYDVIPLSDGSILAYVADVCDKGVPAALIMAAVSTKIRSEAQQESEVEKLIERINNSTYQLLSEEGFFITIVLTRYWPASGKMQILLGGHLPPFWINERGIRKMQASSNISLGATPDARYEKSELLISPGESVLFYSDGVIEARNENMELLGRGRLVDFLNDLKGPPRGKCLLEFVRGWQGNEAISDDITILEIWREKRNQ